MQEAWKIINLSSLSDSGYHMVVFVVVEAIICVNYKVLNYSCYYIFIVSVNAYYSLSGMLS